MLILSLIHFESKILIIKISLLENTQKTTPEQARTVLQGQPQISYSLIALMVRINAVNVDVLQVSHLP